MTTLVELTDWLKSTSQIRVVLVEITGVIGGASSYYLSNRPFTSAGTDTPANTSYESVISGGITFNSSIDIEGGSASIGVGDIEIDNTDGSRDAWLNYVWANKPISVYIGDATWSRSEFVRIFSGLVLDIDTKSRTSINLILVDKLQKLNVAISEAVVGGTGENKDQLLPLVFGECFNITPLLLSEPETAITRQNPAIYQIHTGTVTNTSGIERIVEVRDNGAGPFPSSTYVTDTTLLSPTVLAQGKFSIPRNPVGTLTVSVQGGKNESGAYSSKIGAVIKNILLNYGKRVPSTDINLTQFDQFDINTPYNVGVYINNRENVLDICQQLANSAGAYLVTDLDGKFKLVQLRAGLTGLVTPDYAVTASDMEEKTLSISKKLTVEGAVKLAYCKNWTVQTSGNADGLPVSTTELLAREHFYALEKDTTVIGNYVQSAEPVQKDTLLINSTEATAEANRLLNLKKTPRFVYTATYFSHLLPVELGQTINITHPRFGLSGTGKTGMIVEVNKDWLNGRVTIGVFI
jgi:hypothetical protein